MISSAFTLMRSSVPGGDASEVLDCIDGQLFRAERVGQLSLSLNGEKHVC